MRCSGTNMARLITTSSVCMQFQELSWMDDHRTPFDGKRLKMYIMSMRKVVEAYHHIRSEKNEKVLKIYDFSGKWLKKC